MITIMLLCSQEGDLGVEFNSGGVVHRPNNSYGRPLLRHTAFSVKLFVVLTLPLVAILVSTESL